MSNCQLQPSEITDIFSKLKKMECLQSVDLSANMMESDAVDEIAAMIRNNEHIQSLSLPYCVLDQKDLRIIIQAMQTVSSLRYVDFSNNILRSELVGDVTLLIIKNSKLSEVRFDKLTLCQSGFQLIGNCLIKIKGLRSLHIINCSFTEGNAINLEAIINNNSQIQEINWSNCKIPTDQLLSMLSLTTKLKCLNLSNCLSQPNKIKKIFNVLKQMKCLQCVDLSVNKMNGDAVDETAVMIIGTMMTSNHYHYQVVCLIKRILGLLFKLCKLFHHYNMLILTITFLS